MRYMFIIRSEQSASPSPELMDAMHKLAEREVKAGRMIADGGLMPPGTGAAVRLKKRKLVLLDGPFAETKEVIGGFAVFELPDHEAAIASATEFMGLHQEFMPDWEGVCEIRQVAGSMVELLRSGG